MEPFIIYLGNINGIKSLAYKNTNTPHPIMNNSESILQTIPVWEKLFKYIIRENKTSPIGIIAIYANWNIPNNSVKSSDRGYSWYIAHLGSLCGSRFIR